jgi:hypothetical protein
MFLVDTNIFLEILLRQDKKEDCKSFLDNNIENINVTDFSLHSNWCNPVQIWQRGDFPEIC